MDYDLDIEKFLHKSIQEELKELEALLEKYKYSTNLILTGKDQKKFTDILIKVFNISQTCYKLGYSYSKSEKLLNSCGIQLVPKNGKLKPIEMTKTTKVLYNIGDKK